MKYKTNEISYKKAKKISRRLIKAKKIRNDEYSSINTIYLDEHEYQPTILEKNI